MGNLESTEGSPGEPPSVSLLPPTGKMPMPEPCELEERFALVLVRAEPSPFPLLPPPHPHPQVPAPQVGLCPSPLVRSTPSVRALDRPRPPAPSREPLSSPIRDLPTDRLNRWTLKRRGPQPGTAPGPRLLPRPSPFCRPSRSPHPAPLP